MSATLVYAVSDPTPGLENICPLRSLAEDLNICLMTPSKQRCFPPGVGGDLERDRGLILKEILSLSPFSCRSEEMKNWELCALECSSGCPPEVGQGANAASQCWCWDKVGRKRHSTHRLGVTVLATGCVCKGDYSI